MNAPATDSIIEPPPSSETVKIEPSNEESLASNRDVEEPVSEKSNPDSPSIAEPESPSADTASASVSDTQPSDVTLRLSFLDPSGHVIEGLGYRVMVGSAVYEGWTDAQGKCAPLSGLMPGLSLSICVRKDDGTYASKYLGEVMAGDMEMCGISPWIKVPVVTEEHQGPPTTQPPPSTSKPAAPPQANIPANTARPGALPPPVNARPNGGKKPSVQPDSCRTDQGHPRATLREKFADWADRHGVLNFGLWSWKKLVEQPLPSTDACQSPNSASSPTENAPTQQPKKNSSTPPQTKTAASPPPPPAPPAQSPAISVAVTSANQAPPQQLIDLLAAMEQQVKWPWKSLPPAGAIILKIGANTFEWPQESKPENQSDQRCYKSVKVGLWRARYVRAVNDDIPAHTATSWLIREGFKDVSSELPDARWAWPGDVIVYQYPEAKRAKNDAAAKDAYQKKLTAYEKKKAAAESLHQTWLEDKKDFNDAKDQWEKSNPGKRFAKKFGKPEPNPPPRQAPPKTQTTATLTYALTMVTTAIL